MTRANSASNRTLVPVEAGENRAVQSQVYNEVRRSLIIGRFAPGAKVTLRGLATQVGTSITPVRVAVNRLVAEGAFEVLPNRWLAVPSMTKEKFGEITHWRVQLESEATRRACKHVDKRMLGELEAINRRIVDSVKRGDRSDLLAINYEFHFAIYRASRSSILVPMIESLWLRGGPFTFYSLQNLKEHWSAKHHLEILDALKRRDATAAAAAVTRDILNTADALEATSYYRQPTLNRVAASRAL